MQVILAQPRGFCAGVERAIEIVERALTLYGPPGLRPSRDRPQRHVVERLRAKGARVRRGTGRGAAEGAVTIFSAHGVSTRWWTRREARGLPVIDATCPLVTKVHMEGAALFRAGPRRHPDRPCRSSGGRRHAWASIPARSIWWHRAEDVASARGGATATSRLRHPDDPERRRHARHHRRAEGAVHRYRRPRHATTSATPPRTASARCANWRRRSIWCWWSGRAEQLQFQPPARDRRAEPGVPSLPDRGRLRARSRLARRRRIGRHHRRGFGAGRRWSQDVIATLRRRRHGCGQHAARHRGERCASVCRAELERRSPSRQRLPLPE